MRQYPTFTPVTYTVWFSGYFLVVFNWPFWKAIVEGVRIAPEQNWLFVASIPLTLWALLTIVLSIVAHRYIMKPSLLVLTLIAASACFASLSYGVVYDRWMIANIFETSTREAESYLNLSAILSIAALAALPILFLKVVRVNYSGVLAHTTRWFFCVSICAVIVVVNLGVFYSDYAAFFRNNNHVRDVINPSSYLRQTARYVRDHYIVTPPVHVEIGTDATPDSNSDNRIVVMVLGETARGINYPINGYARDTTAHTDKFELVEFAGVTSCGTATTESLPCMFSRLGQADFKKDIALSQDNVLDIIQRAKFDVTWIENSDGCKGVCRRVDNVVISPKSPDPLCDGTYCYDEALLTQLDLALAEAIQTQRDTLIVLHVIGSHGPTYFRRYPLAHQRFTPDCQRSDIQNCSKEELVNTYDNTILYTDFIVASAIERLAALKIDTALTYMSDHGESLGEKGMYLHGLPYAIAPLEQKSIPWQLWFSPAYLENSLLSTECLRQTVPSQSYSHDNLFHTLLAISGVSTNEYNADLDVISDCKRSTSLIAESGASPAHSVAE